MRFFNCLIKDERVVGRAVEQFSKVDVLRKKPEDVQSANALFNFVNKLDYLIGILEKKAIIPRYCQEDIEYLDLSYNGQKIDRISVLQKCFCDIPLHNITQKFSMEIKEEDKVKIDEEKQRMLEEGNTHIGLYGSYGIAFSKEWCVNHNFQPLQYINEKSYIAKQFKELFCSVSSSEEVSDEIVDDIINRLSYYKPLYGTMPRNTDNGQIRVYKSFLDECEWRYLPDVKELEKYNMNLIIFDEETQKMKEHINDNLRKEKYSSLWLEYDYDDIKYLFVPDNQNRNKLIKAIMEIPTEKFEKSHSNIRGEMARYILISKILVLDDIRKDW